MKKQVLITGASAGIGAAIARRFVQSGNHVILAARREGKLEELRQELGSANVTIIPLDVTSRNAVQNALKSLEVDILVNNAGGAFGLDKAYEADLDDWDKCVDINIKGLMYCTRYVLPGMVKRNRGHVINLGSVAGEYAYPGSNVYGGAKAFVHQFSLNLRADLIGTAVRVTCVEPGIVAGTEFSQTRFRGDEARAQSVYQNVVSLQPEDIAEVIYACTAFPEHVNVNTIEIMPVSQASGPLALHREST